MKQTNELIVSLKPSEDHCLVHVISPWGESTDKNAKVCSNASPSSAISSGSDLFNDLLQGRNRQIVQRSLAEAAERDEWLRLVVSLDSTAWLHAVPWEQLHDERGFLALRGNVTVVRRLRVERCARAFPVIPAARVLLTTSGSDSPVERVIAGVSHPQRDRLPLSTERRASWDSLRRRILQAQNRDRRPFSIWHHCGDLKGRGEQSAFLTAECDERVQPSTTGLERLLDSCPDLQMILLNLPRPLRTPASLATLVRTLSLASILILSEATGSNAVVQFVRLYYQALLSGVPADLALSKTRTALAASTSSDLSWSHSILYLQTTTPLTLLSLDQPYLDPRGLPSELIVRMMTTLCSCAPMYNESLTRDLFIDSRVQAWQNQIPQADNAQARALALINYLWPRRNHRDENALVLFLHVLANMCTGDNRCRQDLVDLADELTGTYRFTR